MADLAKILTSQFHPNLSACCRQHTSSILKGHPCCNELIKIQRASTHPPENDSHCLHPAQHAHIHKTVTSILFKSPLGTIYLTVSGRTTVQQSMHAASTAQCTSYCDISNNVHVIWTHMGAPMCTLAKTGNNLAVLKVASSAHKTANFKEEILQREQKQVLS